ncbi:MAG TPA: helix-turn-helix domain-containing protein [Candidatus Thermoplasmatota archaeon]|nr:helix-turn-helix domain-containing protein [Candidatus Thermoplasmatota archaeon]
MSSQQDRLEKMMEYGLTEYEARTYLALLHLGVASARDVANLSRVPRTKIYSVLDDLHAKQLAEIIPERPKKYGVVPFDSYLRTFEREYKAKLAKIEEDKKMLMAAFASKDVTGPDKAGSFQVLKGRKNVLNRKYEMVGRAIGEILEMGTEFSAVRMGYYMPLLRERARIGAKLSLLVPVTESNKENVEEFAQFGTVCPNPTKSPGSVIMVVDDAEVLICHYVPDDEHLFKGEDIAIWSDDKAIVRDMKATILSQWTGATAAAAGATVQTPNTTGKSIPINRGA